MIDLEPQQGMTAWHAHPQFVHNAEERGTGMPLGWLLLIGGILGAGRALRAKTFSWANEVDNVVSKEDRAREPLMTSSQRRVLVALCLLLSVAGAVLIQKRHEWKLLSPHWSSSN